MSRPTGTRDKKDLYDQIINQLRKHPDGMNAYNLHLALKVNDTTVRLYLSDLVEQGRVVGTAVTKTVIRYTLAPEKKPAKAGAK